MAKKKSKRIEVNHSSGGFGSALGDALKEQGFNVSTTGAPASTAEASDGPASETIDFKALQKIVLRKEKKGRGGKTVTLIQGIQASTSALEALAKDLRRGLGCGARVENQEIVLQGDIRDRAATWFDQQGVRRIIQS